MNLKQLRRNYSSATHYVLSALIPYTEANVKLAFRPTQFFNDIEKLKEAPIKSSALRQAYYRALRDGYLSLDEDQIPRLTKKGKLRLKKYQPKQLKAGAKIFIIFDIPEPKRHLRDKLRIILRELKFEQIQKSVWATEYDVLDYLVEQINTNQLSSYVEILEAAKIEL